MNIFFRNDYEIKPINEKYAFYYNYESRSCYVWKIGKEKTGEIFQGRVEYFGINKNKLYCLIYKFASIDKNGWYVLDLNSEVIEYLQDETVNEKVISEKYKVKITNIHDYYGLSRPR